MTVTLAKKVAFRAELTGSAPADRAQRMAQQVGSAHEKTKSAVSAVDVRLAAVERTVGVGALPLAMGNVAYRLSASQAAYRLIQLTGAHTAARVLTFPDATNATAYERWVSNATTGGFAITVTVAAGTVSIAAGTTRLIQFWGTAPVFLV